MLTRKATKGLEDSINEVLKEVQYKTTGICIDCLSSLLKDNQGFEIDNYTVELCIEMLENLRKGVE